MTEFERARVWEDIQILTRVLEAASARENETQIIEACAHVLRERQKLLADLAEEALSERKQDASSAVTATRPARVPGAASSRRRQGLCPLPPAG